MADEVVRAGGEEARLPRCEALAELEEGGLGDEPGGAGFPQEVEGEVRRHGEAHRTDIGEDRRVEGVIGQRHHGRAGDGAAGAQEALVIIEPHPRGERTHRFEVEGRPVMVHLREVPLQKGDGLGKAHGSRHDVPCSMRRDGGQVSGFVFKSSDDPARRRPARHLAPRPLSRCADPPAPHGDEDHRPRGRVREPGPAELDRAEIPAVAGLRRDPGQSRPRRADAAGQARRRPPRRPPRPGRHGRDFSELRRGRRPRGRGPCPAGAAEDRLDAARRPRR